MEPPPSPNLLRQVPQRPAPRRRHRRAPSLELKVDYEAEVAFVIGTRASEVDESQALDHVAGYTLLNDLSARDLQFATPQWMPGKVFDGSAPCGPALVTPDEAGPHDAIGISLDLNGEAHAGGHHRGPDLRIPAIVSHLSTADDPRARRHRVHRDAGGRRRDPRPPRLAQARRRDRDQLADAGVLETRIAEPGACASPRLRPRNRGQRERQEPDDVEVEPVRRRELDGDRHRRCQRGDLGRGLAPRPEGDRDRQGAAITRSARIAGSERRRLAPDAEWGAAGRLVAERAVVELAQAAVGDERDDERRDEGANTAERRSPAASAARRRRSRTAAPGPPGRTWPPRRGR